MCYFLSNLSLKSHSSVLRRLERIFAELGLQVGHLVLTIRQLVQSCMLVPAVLDSSVFSGNICKKHSDLIAEEEEEVAETTGPPRLRE